MKTQTINPTNAPRAAEFILFLDTSAISEDYRSPARSHLELLRNAFSSYQLLMQKSYLVMFTKATQSKLVKINLDSMLRHTTFLIETLIPEAQTKLAEYLADPAQERPVAKLFFKENVEADCLA
jgi:hypothetical protein